MGTIKCTTILSRYGTANWHALSLKRLPISKLIRLFSSDHFICNFSITFIDASIEHHPESYYEECGIALIESLKTRRL